MQTQGMGDNPDPADDDRICDECGDKDVDVFETPDGLFICACCQHDQARRAAVKPGGEAK